MARITVRVRTGGTNPNMELRALSSLPASLNHKRFNVERNKDRAVSAGAYGVASKFSTKKRAKAPPRVVMAGRDAVS